MTPEPPRLQEKLKARGNCSEFARRQGLRLTRGTIKHCKIYGHSLMSFGTATDFYSSGRFDLSACGSLSSMANVSSANSPNHPRT